MNSYAMHYLLNFLLCNDEEYQEEKAGNGLNLSVGIPFCNEREMNKQDSYYSSQ